MLLTAGPALRPQDFFREETSVDWTGESEWTDSRRLRTLLSSKQGRVQALEGGSPNWNSGERHKALGRRIWASEEPRAVATVVASGAE